MSTRMVAETVVLFVVAGLAGVGLGVIVHTIWTVIA